MKQIQETKTNQKLNKSIEQITVEINFYKKQTAQNIIEIGKRLIEAKKQLKHGEWLPWLRDKVSFTERTANNFIRVAEHYSNRKPVSDLPYTKLLALLQVPEDEREDFMQETHIVNGQEKTVPDMSKRELQQVIKEKNKAEEEKKIAEKNAEKAQEKAHQWEAQSSKNFKAYQEEHKLLLSLQNSKRNDLEKISNLEKQIKKLESRPVEVAVQELSEKEKQKFRDEGAESVKDYYDMQLADVRQQLEDAKTQTRQNMGLDETDIASASVKFKDTLDSVFDNFKLLLRVAPVEYVEAVEIECTNHIKGLIEDLDETVSIIRNIALLDEDFELPPEDGLEA